ncbi:MAG TPA: bifunctional 5,10-methylenetetrahydrofolate dehydrogenase/5,10-methenyltetrahydrofolate cyclohydrolase [Nitrososphaeraceae archaeon]
MKTKIINGISVAKRIQETIKEAALKLKNQGITPCLATVLVGDDASSITYINKKQKAAKEVGILTKDLRFKSTLQQNELIEVISSLNQDNYVHGILIQLPLPVHLDQLEIIRSLEPRKDVDGLTPFNAGMLLNGNPTIKPCTPAGILELLDFYEIEVIGMDIVIVNRSNLVGKPLACLLIQRGATVTICHSKSVRIDEKLKTADMIVTAVGDREGFTLKGDMIKDNAIIVDVGITRHEGKICGDVEFDSVKEKASWITPVPGGVGPMTVAMLLKNTISAAMQSGKIKGYPV